MELAESVKAEPEVKSKKVTFETGLPMGTRATFMHEGEKWIAYPRTKVSSIAALQHKLIGTIDRVHDDLVRWINRRPADAAEVAQVLARTGSAQELAKERAQAWTQ